MVHKCAVVGCTATKSRNRGLSFHSIKRKNNLDWQNKLAWSVRRGDSLFNPNTATICSRHFETSCFVTSGKNENKYH